MIRKWLHGRWLRRSQLLASIKWELEHWNWLDRYMDWDVAKYGEAAGGQPWWDKYVVGKLLCWIVDWRGTLSLKMGRGDEPPGYWAEILLEATDDGR